MIALVMAAALIAFTAMRPRALDGDRADRG